MKNKILLFTIFCLSINLFSQNLNDSWQVGIGMGITKFNKSDASFIGDTYQFQVPVISLTMPIGERLSIDGAMSVNTIDDIGLINNSASYFSIDGSLRYNFNVVLEKFSPYAFIGASVVDSEKKMTPTFNLGAGGIYWITDKIGVNPQIYYKHSLSSFDSMRSHIQGTLGLVFKLNWNNISKGTQGVSVSGVGCM